MNILLIGLGFFVLLSIFASVVVLSALALSGNASRELMEPDHASTVDRSEDGLQDDDLWQDTALA